ncbi:hypothetical protein J6590_013449 [Homalodisca vitripennis]|nr:hypothetical protein J6590_013449 [Homalodisca vitripennis]
MSGSNKILVPEYHMSKADACFSEPRQADAAARGGVPPYELLIAVVLAMSIHQFFPAAQMMSNITKSCHSHGNRPVLKKTTTKRSC